MGTADLQEPNAAGGAPTGPAAAATVQVRGSIYYPANRATGSPVIMLVHGNHGSCDSGSAPNCTAFKRNDRGYAYLGENLATWGYTVMSLDQDQLIYYQDSAQGKGMHQRRLLMAAALDALYAANQAPMPANADNNLGARARRQARLLAHRPDGPLARRRRASRASSTTTATRPAPGPQVQPARRDLARPGRLRAPRALRRAVHDDVRLLRRRRLQPAGRALLRAQPVHRARATRSRASRCRCTAPTTTGSTRSGSPTATTPTGTDAACGTSQPNNIRLSGGTYTLDDPRLRRPGADGRPGEGRPGDDVRRSSAATSAATPPSTRT